MLGADFELNRQLSFSYWQVNIDNLNLKFEKYGQNYFGNWNSQVSDKQINHKSDNRFCCFGSWNCSSFFVWWNFFWSFVILFINWCFFVHFFLSNNRFMFSRFLRLFCDSFSRFVVWSYQYFRARENIFSSFREKIFQMFFSVSFNLLQLLLKNSLNSKKYFFN